MTMNTINTGTTFVKIQSDSDPNKRYTVEIENGHAWWCECKDWQVRRREDGCKHMKEAQSNLDAVAGLLEGLSE